MSKIAILAPNMEVVRLWRRQTGLLATVAPWVVNERMVNQHRPFVSLICLSGWDTTTDNLILKGMIERYHLIRAAAEDDNVEGSTPESTGTGRISLSESVADATNPDMPPQERRLRENGCSAAFIGMLSDEERNTLCNSLTDRDEGRLSQARWMIMASRLAQAYGLATAFALTQPSARDLEAEERDRLVRDIVAYANVTARRIERLPIQSLRLLGRYARLMNASRNSTEHAGAAQAFREAFRDATAQVDARQQQLVEESNPATEEAEPTDDALGFLPDQPSSEQYAAMAEARIREQQRRAPAVRDDLAAFMRSLRQTRG